MLSRTTRGWRKRKVNRRLPAIRRVLVAFLPSCVWADARRDNHRPTASPSTSAVHAVPGFYHRGGCRVAAPFASLAVMHDPRANIRRMIAARDGGWRAGVPRPEPMELLGWL